MEKKGGFSIPSKASYFYLEIYIYIYVYIFENVVILDFFAAINQKV